MATAVSAHRLIILATCLSGTVAGCSPTPRTLTFLPAPADLQAITIQDVVRGPEAASRLFPMEARYTLRRDGSAFRGTATFSVGSKSDRPASQDVVVPIEAVERYLDGLAGALLREGYDPQKAPPGGAFPDVRIELRSASGTIPIFTQSPGAQFLPWAVEHEGRTYTIESTAPATAFAELQPYLKRDTLDRLATEAISAGRR